LTWDTPPIVLEYERNAITELKKRTESLDYNHFTEPAAIFSQEGTILWEGLRDLLSILTPDECQLMKGNIFTHFHPSGLPFSSYDVITCADCQVRELRVFTFINIYSIKPNALGWPCETEIEEKLSLIERSDEYQDHCRLFCEIHPWNEHEEYFSRLKWELFAGYFDLIYSVIPL